MKYIFCMVIGIDENRGVVRDSADRITGLIGKNQFLYYVRQAVEKISISGKCRDAIGRIIYFNIRNLKVYNLQFGREEGDNLLRATAGILQKHFQTGICSRFSEDHFVVFTLDENVNEKVQRVHDEFELIYGMSGVSIKAGIKKILDYDLEISILCECARIACDSIHDSLDQFLCEYRRELSENLETEAYILRHLDQAILYKQIEVYYQPVIRTKNGRVCGFEALARWNDPEKGLLHPACFIPILEKHDLITILDLHILDLVCRELRRQLDENRKHAVVPVSVNLSRRDILSGNIVGKVDCIVKKWDVPSELICIELTESILVSDSHLVRETLHRFRERGYQVWMDDFGAGYSSLNKLKSYCFDQIKLDRVFLSDSTTRARHIIRSIITLAKDLDMETLAEGVENQEQFDFLRIAGCEKVQGYFFGKPLPFSLILKELKEKGIMLEVRRI